MPALIKKPDCVRSVSGGVDRVSFLDEILPQRVGHCWFVVYHKNPHFFVLHLFLLSRNRCALRHDDDYSPPINENLQPESGSSTANFLSINFAVPPCASMILAARASLISSLPSNERNGSWSNGRNPDHSIRTCPAFAGLAVTVTSPAPSSVRLCFSAPAHRYLKASPSLKWSKLP